MATDDWAHTVLMAALSVTDDTALLQKCLVPELVVRPRFFEMSASQQ